MNNSTLQYIRHLTSKDTKTLSQKTLKSVEEVGELAKVVLPYENAHCTTHRFVERERILEEAVDSILCNLSIAYSLDFTDDEVDAMMVHKSEKWARLQSNESGVTYPLPFEIHVTVKIQPTGSIDLFKLACSQAGVKPIILDLQGKSGTTVMIDVMTSSKHFGDNKSAYIEAKRIEHMLGSTDGLDVVRLKIETVPWHPAAPRRPGDHMPPNCYFESHIPVIIAPADDDKLRCTMFGVDGVHTSRNVFKTLDDGRIVVMVTYRSYDCTRDQFDQYVVYLTELFQKFDWIELGKVHTEFAVYDTKVSHDVEWLKG